jgi:hypothetical protein
VLGDELADALEPRKPAWPSLVWNTWASRPSASQRPHAADAEHHLLAEAVLGVAAVQAVGDAPQLDRAVALHVGVEQVQRMRPTRRATRGLTHGRRRPMLQAHLHVVGG